MCSYSQHPGILFADTSEQEEDEGRDQRETK
jgi:hypothetical protein